MLNTKNYHLIFQGNMEYDVSIYHTKLENCKAYLLESNTLPLHSSLREA